jgi:hypothetical protein
LKNVSSFKNATEALATFNIGEARLAWSERSEDNSVSREENEEVASLGRDLCPKGPLLNAGSVSMVSMLEKMESERWFLVYR